MMLKYKWCVCDMDGTLLDSNGLISEENEAALKKLQDNGLEVILASGRVDLMLKPFIKQLDLKGPIMCCNGALIKDLKTGKILYSKTIEKPAVKEIVNYCFSNSIHFLMYTTEFVYSTKDNPRTVKFENLNKTLSEDLKIPLKYFGSEILENLDELDLLKILLVCGDKKMVEEQEKHFLQYDNLSAVSSQSGVLDIMAANISKANGLKILSEKLKVDLKDVIAFGDNNNDVEMLEIAGLPVAVENAVDSAKLKAKYITKSNDESGVAYAINNFILKE